MYLLIILAVLAFNMYYRIQLESSGEPDKNDQKVDSADAEC